jgi:hypothetical protein
VTTPFLARHDRMDIADIGEALENPEDTAEASMRTMLLDLQDVPTDGVAGEDVTVVPAAYGPDCGRHVALEMSDGWRVGTVEGPDGVDDVFPSAFFVGYERASIQEVERSVPGRAWAPCPPSRTWTTDAERCARGVPQPFSAISNSARATSTRPGLSNHGSPARSWFHSTPSGVCPLMHFRCRPAAFARLYAG